jgi:ketosteroid isomerase-like protein
MTPKRLKILLSLSLMVLLPALAAAHGITEGDKQAMLAGGNLQYLILGATHMLTGYDHLLFIFGVIFFLTGFRDILKYITAFTLGHSITLVFATLMGFSVNYFLIDAVIALSVCYKGFENLDGFNRYLGKTAPNLLGVIFAFGLIHGLGLAARLQQLPLGDEGLIMRILSFNVGVELGQIAALIVMVSIIAGWRRTQSFNRFATFSNGTLIATGLLLFVMQIHGFGHNINLNLFGFESSAQAMVEPMSGENSDALKKTLSAYDEAFENRDVMALWNLFDEDIVLYEQGTQNVGREDALGKHLAPDLQAFVEMSSNFSDVRIKEMNGMAIRTRHFTVKGKLPSRYFMAQGFETQNWALREGQWKLIHMHWSFPVGR